MGAAPVLPAKSSFRPDVQGLRAFAVVAVILAHITGWPTGGFIGVDVFFVISGFLITGLLLREHEKTGRISFADFYKRRVKRILPASILVLGVTTLAAVALLPKTRSDSTIVDAVWSLFFVGNWRFASSGTDYFQEGVPASPLQHFWSLAVEEQFYFVWPWLMLGIFFLTARLGRHATGRLTVGLVMAGICIASFAWAMWETTNNPTVAYFSTLSRTWELGIGALIAVAAPMFVRIPAGLRTLLAWAGLTGLLAAVLVITPESVFPAPWALLPVLSTALIIAAGTGGAAKHLYPLTNRVSGYIGDISYSLYLWHWPVAILLVAVLESGTLLFYVYAITLSIALSVASYHFVEDPLRHWGSAAKKSAKKSSNRARATAGMTVLALFTVLLVGLAAKADGDRTAEAGNLAPVARPTAGATAAPACMGAAALDPNANCNRSTVVASLSPSIDRMNKDTGNAFKCWSGEGEDMKSCSYGSAGDGSVRMAVAGDSHAASLIPALTTGSEMATRSLDTFVGNGCQWRAFSPDNKTCGKAMQQIQEQLTGSDPYDVVVTTASRTKTGSDPAVAIQQFKEAWKPVLDLGTKVVVVADVPAVDEAAIECVNRIGFDPTTADCSTPADRAFAQADVLLEAAQGMEGVTVIDMNDLLCVEGKCPMVIGGTLVYRDAASHLTATYAATLAPYLSQRIAAAVIP